MHTQLLFVATVVLVVVAAPTSAAMPDQVVPPPGAAPQGDLPCVVIDWDGPSVSIVDDCWGPAPP